MRISALVLAGLVVVVSRGDAEQSESCTPSRDTRTATEWLAAATKAIGADRIGARVLASQATVTSSWNYQSDRPWYPPFLADHQLQAFWYDPSTGVEGFAPAAAPPAARPVTLSTAGAAFLRRDTTVVPVPPLYASVARGRPLNPWAVVRDWQTAGGARVTGQCVYREYPRVVLTRTGANGDEQLLIDPKAGFPVAYRRTEPHYMWGQVAVEYVYVTWQQAGPGYYPLEAYRLVDGKEDINRALVLGRAGPVTLLDRDSAPNLTVPDPSLTMPVGLEVFLQPTPPDTIRVANNAFLLKNRGYTEMVALERDTVFMFEATQAEERARQDSVWIGRLFPGKHPVAVVVTDLAWPHISGMRFWVAAGATIISHQTSRTMIDQVLARRWTLHPDWYERRRAASPLKFRAVKDSLVLAGGAVAVYPIDGIGSEGALMGWLRDARFLWASDFIQDPSQPTLYTTEVWMAARRVGVTPASTAAQHFPLTLWGKIEALAAPRATTP